MKATGFSRVSKERIIGEIQKELKERPLFFVAEHGRVPASTMDKLRVKLRQSRARYLVIKNSLGRKAFEREKLAAEFSEAMKGSCGIAFSSGDPVASSKILVEFAKENEAFKIRGGFMNGRVMGLDQIKTLASLPSREVLLARVARGMQAPISRLAGVLAGTVRKVVNVLDAIKKLKEREPK
ncbi:MAG: 50S ribosomal protein L10 [Candidatus Omnitrophica bacterium]|nr:50S ribosomal protein L10 [Candidatus Omnitrophota bacterium]